MAPTNAASKTRLELASNWNALEAVGTGGIDDSTALFSKTLATALFVGVACVGAVVMRKPFESYDFGSAEAPAATVMTVVKPC